MSSIQSVIGSSFQFAPPITGLNLPGALPGVPNGTNGLIKRRYNQGYFNEDPNWFDGKTPDVTEVDATVSIDTNADNYSILWTGYFYVPNTGLYRFKTYSDDGSYAWMGNNAVSGYTNSNVVINNGMAHGPQDAISAYYQLSAGDYYPIRIVFGEIGGGDIMRFYYEFNNNNVFIAPGDNSLFVHNSLSVDGL